MIRDYLGFFNYAAAIFLFTYGLYSVASQKNLVRKIFALTFVQTAVIIFYITLSYKKAAVLPIMPETSHGGPLPDPALYANPLPAALMLTAIVVGVSTLGVALTLMLSIYRSYKTLEEDEILEKI